MRFFDKVHPLWVGFSFREGIAFPEALHPVNRSVHKHAWNKLGKSQIMPARAKRKRT